MEIVADTRLPRPLSASGVLSTRANLLVLHRPLPLPLPLPLGAQAFSARSFLVRPTPASVAVSRCTRAHSSSAAQRPLLLGAQALLSGAAVAPLLPRHLE